MKSISLTAKKAVVGVALATPLMLGLGAPLAQAAIADTNVNVTILAQEEFSDNKDIQNSSDAATTALKREVSSQIKGNTYQLQGGGFVQGSDLMNSSGQVNDAVYTQLNNKAQNQFVNDIVTNTNILTDPNNPRYNSSLAKSDGVDQSTASNWFKELRSNSGIGSAMLTATLKDGVYADLNTGGEWFRPFQGPLSSFLGFMCIVVISLMGIRSILDLSYISLPFFQAGYDKIEGGSGGGGGASGGGGSSGGFKMVSTAARTAVQEAESGANPIWAYFKKAALEYVVLGLAILFLCFNYMWDLAGVVMDAGMGLLGFA